MKRRLTIFTLTTLSMMAIISAVFTAPSAFASPDTNTTIERFSVPFALPWTDQYPCTEMPPGVTSITGTANFRVVTTTRVDDDGTIYLNQNAFADGAATDNLGTNYGINYASHLDLEIPPGDYPQQLRFTDHFNLNGRGKNNQMHVGFLMVGTIEDPDDAFPWHTNFISLRGDAIGCDPI